MLAKIVVLQSPPARRWSRENEGWSGRPGMNVNFDFKFRAPMADRAPQGDVQGQRFRVVVHTKLPLTVPHGAQRDPMRTLHSSPARATELPESKVRAPREPKRAVHAA